MTREQFRQRFQQSPTPDVPSLQSFWSGDTIRIRALCLGTRSQTEAVCVMSPDRVMSPSATGSSGFRTGMHRTSSSAIAATLRIARPVTSSTGSRTTSGTAATGLHRVEYGVNTFWNRKLTIRLLNGGPGTIDWQRPESNTGPSFRKSTAAMPSTLSSRRSRKIFGPHEKLWIRSWDYISVLEDIHRRQTQPKRNQGGILMTKSNCSTRPRGLKEDADYGLPKAERTRGICGSGTDSSSEFRHRNLPAHD